MSKRLIYTFTISVLLISVVTGCYSTTNISTETSAYVSSEISADATVTDNTAPSEDGIDFSDIKYEHYDPTHIYELIDSATPLIDNKANAQKVLDLFDEILDEEDILSLSNQLAELYNSIDVNDKYYIDEFTYSSELLVNVDDKICILGKKILNSPCEALARKNWEPTDIEYFDKYIELTDEQRLLLKKEKDLILKYNKESEKEYTVKINGKKYNLIELYSAPELSYEDYQKGYNKLMLAECKVLGPIYLDLIKVRKQIAASYGYDSYTSYCYKEVFERKYSPDDALKLCSDVKTDLVPVYALFDYSFDHNLGYELDSKIAQMPINKQMDLVEKYLPKVDRRLSDSFSFMKKYHLYDLEPSETKMATGFTTFFSVHNEPFIFNQPEGSFYDLMSIVHEFGHFNSNLVNRDRLEYQNNLDLAEIHSQGLEMLYTKLYDEMLEDTYKGMGTDYTLYIKLGTILDGCLYDEFQQEVYKLKNPTIEKINKICGRLQYEYGYSDSPDTPSGAWVIIPHNFQSPLYYISYSLSALPAFEIWADSLTDYKKACQKYSTLVEIGQDDNYEKALTDSGLTSPFSEGYTRELADSLLSYVK